MPWHGVLGVDGEGGGAEVQPGGEDRRAPRERKGGQVRDGLHQEVRPRAQRPRQRRCTKVRTYVWLSVCLSTSTFGLCLKCSIRSVAFEGVSTGV